MGGGISGSWCDTGGYARSRFNATQHGLTARHLLLPWEDPDEFKALLAELVDEHRPRGPTERHLVSEIAAVMWRQRRVLQAEGATIRDELRTRLGWHDERTAVAALAHVASSGKLSAVPAVEATEGQTQAELADIEQDEAMTLRALRILRRAGPNAYENAVAALRQDTREWWQEILEEGPDEDDEEEGRGPYEASPASLKAFIEEKVLEDFAEKRAEIANRTIVREYAFAAASAHANLDRLSRYETHLDRKLNRLLGTLLGLQETRRTINGTAEQSVSQKMDGEKSLPHDPAEVARLLEDQGVDA